MSHRIEICGNIASGKTTLCQQFKKGSFLQVFENFKKNPFYEDFYQDPLKYSFETELTFLLQHYHEIKKYSSNSQMVCDYSILQDMAYADINLTGSRHKSFFEVVHEVQKEVGYPDKIIHITCSEEMLLERIRMRNRQAESSISIAYLQSLARAIELRVEEVPSGVDIITIDSAKIDFRYGIEHIHLIEFL